MNPLNYCTREAAQRLSDVLRKAGMPIMETDCNWQFMSENPDTWKVLPKDDCYPGSIPAPSMSEVWRELPECGPDGGRKCLMGIKGINVAGYSSGEGFDCSDNFTSENPTDALIDLYIWLIERKKQP